VSVFDLIRVMPGDALMGESGNVGEKELAAPERRCSVLMWPTLLNGEPCAPLLAHGPSHRI